MLNVKSAVRNRNLYKVCINPTQTKLLFLTLMQDTKRILYRKLPERNLLELGKGVFVTNVLQNEKPSPIPPFSTILEFAWKPLCNIPSFSPCVFTRVLTLNYLCSVRPFIHTFLTTVVLWVLWLLFLSLPLFRFGWLTNSTYPNPWSPQPQYYSLHLCYSFRYTAAFVVRKCVKGATLACRRIIGLRWILDTSNTPVLIYM